MAQTIADIEVGTAWLDLNTASGITSGTKMIIQNKGGVDLLVHESIAEPAADVSDGWFIHGVRQWGSTVEIPAGAINIWVRTMRGKTKINVR